MMAKLLPEDEIIDQGTRLHSLYAKYLKGVSLTRLLGYQGPSILSTYTFFVGKEGRIFRYDPTFDEWPPYATIQGEYKRVKFELWDSEDPRIADIYRSTCADGPYLFIAQIQNLSNNPNNPTIWYDYTVDWNIPYYYLVNGRQPTGNPATPYGLSNPPAKPPTPVNFIAQDKPLDDGGRAYLAWDYTGSSYTLYRDGNFFALLDGYEYNYDSCVTGYNHTFKVRKRQYYSGAGDYIYSDPAIATCTAINNLVPTAPTNLTGEYYPGGVIKLRWIEPNNVDIHGYNIYRKINIGGNYIKVNLVPCPRPFWYDTPPMGYRSVWYKVSAVDWAGNESGYSNEIYFDAAGTPRANEQGSTAELVETKLEKIIPNPATRTVLINFSLDKDDFVHLAIYDATGRTVKNLIADNYTSGNHRLKFDVQSDNELSPGVYFVQMKTGDFKAVEKVIIAR